MRILYNAHVGRSVRRTVKISAHCASAAEGQPLIRDMYATAGSNAVEIRIPLHAHARCLTGTVQEFCAVYNMVCTAEYLYNDEGICLRTDCPCDSQLINSSYRIEDGAIVCDWFLNAVQPSCSAD